MAAPRIFVSSTYYDLRQTRDNIKGFIEGLGYEAVMHEHSGVAYTQNTNLEKDCYREISGCEIVVSIIGNSFGSQSSENELSITMNEIKTAIKNKKKVYIFIAEICSTSPILIPIGLAFLRLQVLISILRAAAISALDTFLRFISCSSS